MLSLKELISSENTILKEFAQFSQQIRKMERSQIFKHLENVENLSAEMKEAELSLEKMDY